MEPSTGQFSSLDNTDVTAPPAADAFVGSHRRASARAPWHVFAAIAVAYLVAGLALLPEYRYQLNPDGTAYLTIARQYFDGQWSEAVNGLWSPMFSWLLAPLLGMGADPLLAARGLNLAAGLLVLSGLWALSGRFTDRVQLRTIAAVAMAPVVLAWSYSVITPDLLVVGVLLYYLYVVTSPRFASALRFAVGAGLLGGVAYLTKGYSFPFFIAHFVGYCGWRAWRARGTRRRRWIRQLLGGLGCFALISGPWVAIVSAKYGYLTQSTAMDYNWKLMGPAYQGEHPTYRPGLLDPTSPHAASAWEDPTTLPMNSWSATAHPTYFLHLLASNVFAIFKTLLGFTLLSLIIVAVGALFVLLRRSPVTRRERHMLLFTGFTLALAVGGYAIVKLEIRYIWIASPLLALAAVLLVGAAQRHRLVNRVAVTLAVVALVGSFWLPAGRELAGEWKNGESSVTTADELRRAVPAVAGANVASNVQPRESLYVSYLVKARYYGLAPTAPAEAASALKAKGIRYFIYWQTPGPLPDYLRSAPTVFARDDHQFTVYRLDG